MPFVILQTFNLQIICFKFFDIVFYLIDQRIIIVHRQEPNICNPRQQGCGHHQVGGHQKTVEPLDERGVCLHHREKGVRYP